MPLSSLAVDALGVVTICLVVVLVLLGLFCIIYTLYFRARIWSSGFVRLGYFNGPWFVRITFIAFGICWGAGEVIRSTFFRQEGKVFHSLDQKWQENLCKLYILSNLGFTEPCLFLIMSFLLHASLKWRDSGILNKKWNMRTTGYVLLYCLPIFLLDLVIVIVAPKLRHGKINVLRQVSEKFTNTYLPLTVSGRTGLGLRGIDAGGQRSGTSVDNHAESIWLMAAAANQGIVETSTATTSVGRNSDASTKLGSISFRTMIKDEASLTGIYEEEMAMAPFSPGFPSSPAA